MSLPSEVVELFISRGGNGRHTIHSAGDSVNFCCILFGLLSENHVLIQ